MNCRFELSIDLLDKINKMPITFTSSFEDKDIDYALTNEKLEEIKQIMIDEFKESYPKIKVHDKNFKFNYYGLIDYYADGGIIKN